MKHLLMRLARLRVGGWLVHWVVAYMSFLIPTERLYESATLLAFFHPQPSYKIHILLVPKKSIKSMTELGVGDSEFLVEVFTTVQKLVAQLNLKAFRVTCNGGDYQDVPYLHFHLVSDV